MFQIATPHTVNTIAIGLLADSQWSNGRRKRHRRVWVVT